ncbi:MAG: pyruvate kinase [Longimicrobiales bacterium]|nr:pyruvate kinase [Longimicrobiales bacterium]
MKNIEYPMIVVTLGPTSMNETVLKKLSQRKISFVRINLSHTPIESLESTVDFIRSHCTIPLMLDTEGSQVRTGVLPEAKSVTENEEVLLATQGGWKYGMVPLRPDEVLMVLKEGDLISLDFDSVLLRVNSLSMHREEGTVQCTVMSGGTIQSNKAVTVFDQSFQMPSLSDKDVQALEIAREIGIENFCLSFVDGADDVRGFRHYHPDAFVLSKVETSLAIENLEEIIEVSDGVLIDRGDLSRQVPLERIPFAQKYVINKVNLAEKPVLVATNFLDTMMESRSASRAETNDIVNTLLDGATGLVLAAETAIGQHPVETVSFLVGLCDEVVRFKRSIKDLEVPNGGVLPSAYDTNYITSPALGCGLIAPHGGVLVDQRWKGEIPEGIPRLELSVNEAMDVEQIALGGYSPLRGFMNKGDLDSVMRAYQLQDGAAWPLPILLRRSGSKLPTGEVVLTFDGEPIGVMEIEEHHTTDWQLAAELLFGTLSMDHPGVRKFLSEGETALSGPVWLINRVPRNGKGYELKAAETRQVFAARGWSRIVGFHTRNAPHRAHEHIMTMALENTGADGILIHPAVGMKKSGDFSSAAIIEGYQGLLEVSELTPRALFSTFSTYSRYAGPREALFTALCRQNYGCTHFIVGRDHTGVGNFYSGSQAKDLFENNFQIEIQPVFFDEVKYSSSRKSYGSEVLDSDTLDISGTEVRAIIRSGERPPKWYMRPEVSDRILLLREEAFVSDG